MVNTSNAMGLRSFVALPVEKDGGVFRLFYQQSTSVDVIASNIAYGLSAEQTLMLGFSYLSSEEKNSSGDTSVMYRHIVWQDDEFSGTNRLGILGGIIIPENDDQRITSQVGMVFTHFNQHHEIDFDTVYQKGSKTRPESARYDLSWQYRLSPTVRPNWGLATEINSVLELNGRWKEGNNTTHQVTAGLQWISNKWIIEGGLVKDLNNQHELRYVISTRFHF